MTTPSMFRYMCLTGIFLLYTAPAISKQNPAAITPQKINDMRQEREAGPIDKRKLAKKQEAYERKMAIRAQKGKKKALRKTLRDMTLEETRAGKDKLVAEKNYVIAIKYLDRALKLSDDIDDLEQLTLENADLHFLIQEYQKAATIYSQFTYQYPGSIHTEYALYRAIVCTSKLTLSPDRDQTKTQEAIDLAQLFLTRSDVFTQYKEEVQTILVNAQQLLAQSEISVINFYAQQGSFSQAQKRLDDMRTKWLPKLPTLELQLLTLEWDLAKQQKNTIVAQAKEAEIKQRFPDNATLVAHNKSKSFLSRF